MSLRARTRFALGPAPRADRLRSIRRSRLSKCSRPRSTSHERRPLRRRRPEPGTRARALTDPESERRSERPGGELPGDAADSRLEQRELSRQTDGRAPRRAALPEHRERAAAQQARASASGRPHAERVAIEVVRRGGELGAHDAVAPAQSVTDVTARAAVAGTRRRALRGGTCRRNGWKGEDEERDGEAHRRRSYYTRASFERTTWPSDA